MQAPVTFLPPQRLQHLCQRHGGLGVTKIMHRAPAAFGSRNQRCSAPLCTRCPPHGALRTIAAAFRIAEAGHVSHMMRGGMGRAANEGGAARDSCGRRGVKIAPAATLWRLTVASLCAELCRPLRRKWRSVLQQPPCARCWPSCSQRCIWRGRVRCLTGTPP